MKEPQTVTEPAPAFHQYRVDLTALWGLFLLRAPVSFFNGMTRWDFKFLNAIEFEDGSGQSFNLTGYLHNGRPFTLHIRTKYLYDA